MIGRSIYEKHKNTTQQWLPTDSQWRWAKNSNDPVTKKTLEDLGWSSDNIQYTFNEHGFRADEFVGDGVMFLGCSLTAGIGMDLERSWTNIVSKYLNLKNWNMGQGAGSPDTCFRMAYHWLHILKPKYVCVLLPFAIRKEVLVAGGDILSYYPMMPECGPFYSNWISTPDNATLSSAKNAMAIQKMCDDANIPVIWGDWDVVERSPEDLGRDLIHPGAEWNAGIAEYFIQNIENLK